ncbi:MAG: hypothetical protein QXR58_00605 [Candidatus Micrarchaeaceae archaeon]
MQKHIKAIIALIVVVAVAFAVLVAYVKLQISRVSSLPPPPVSVPGKANISANVSGQNLLFYNSGKVIIPYALIAYSSRNISQLNAFSAIYAYPLPSKIYMLNTTDECLNCGNIYSFFSALSSDLASYGIGQNSAPVQNVSLQNLSEIPNDSVLIVPNGLFPSQILENYGNTNASLLQYLMLKGTSIIYVGGSFSNMLLPGGVVTPSPALPAYLSTVAYSKQKIPPITVPNFSLYFSNPEFSFAQGSSYYNLTFINVGNTRGSIVAFSNYLNSWSSPSQAASDIAKTITSLIWLPSYSTGFESLLLSPKSSGSFGITMPNPQINYTYPEIASLDSGYGRVVLYTNSTFSPASNSLYYMISYKPSFYINGTLALPKALVPNGASDVQMVVFTNSIAPIQIEAHITVYDLNMSEVYSTSLPPISAFGNFTFIKHLSFPLGPGDYIASLQSFYDRQYAASLLVIPNITIKPIVQNFSSGTFIFSISDLGEPISGVNYTISANKLYPESGTVQNGTIVYNLPKGSPQMFGHINFEIQMFSKSFPYLAYNPPRVVSINKQYLELSIVLIIVFLMVVLIRAPNRDEFYIDVPILPPQQKTNIKIPYKEVLSSFDKLNAYYHWRYMPLSIKEVKGAISNYIRYNNMPVSLTYSNIELILDKLISKGLLVEIDGLYMPSYWSEQSGHSYEYLATFKKLRTYFVTSTFVFSDLDSSNLADIVTTVHGERAYFVIYAETSKFKKIRIYPDIKTYIAFLNFEKLSEFRSQLYNSTSQDSEKLKMYISAGIVKLVDADNPGDYIS